MAIYHFEAKMISRGTGRSVVAASAYASCSQLYNDYDGVTHDYAKKHGNIYSEIFLPSNAPPEWKDRNELWNAVEAAEKSKDSRLARELVVALPIELEPEDWESMLKEFIKEECTDKGMCADVNIHDTDGHNPHAHLLLTVRPLDEKGKWQAKTQKEYLCKRGDEEQGFADNEFKAAQADGWEKQYQYKVGKKKVYMTSSEAEQRGYERVSKNPKSTRNPICAEWNSEEQILQWRKAWENVINNALERKSLVERVDCRSFAKRGIDEQPTIHEGVTARIIEQRGGVSDRCEINRQIKTDNILLRKLKKLINSIENTAAKIAEKLEGIRNNLISVFHEIKCNKNIADEIQHDNRIIDILLREYNKVIKSIDKIGADLEKLKSEKAALPPIHIFKHKALFDQIEQVKKTLKNLENRKSVLLDDMGVKSEKEVSKIKGYRHNNNTTLENISKKNNKLNVYSEKEKTLYNEIKANLSPEELSAVQEERHRIREVGIKNVMQKIKNTSGMKYDYSIFKEAETDVGKALNEKPIQKKSILLQLNRKQQQSMSQYNKKHEIER